MHGATMKFMYTQYNINSLNTNKNNWLQNLTLAGVAATLWTVPYNVSLRHRHWLAIQVYIKNVYMYVGWF